MVVGENGMDIGAIDMTTAASTSLFLAERDILLEAGVKINSWDPSDDQHLSDSFAFSKGVHAEHLPFTSIAGVTATWANHRHETDGTDLIPEGGFDDGAFLKPTISDTIFGTTSSDALNGEDGNKSFNFMKEGIAASHNALGPNLKLPMFSQFLSPWEIRSISRRKGTTVALKEAIGSGVWGMHSGNSFNQENRRLFDDFGPKATGVGIKNYGAGISRCHANPLGPAVSVGNPDYLKYTGLLVSDPIDWPGVQTSTSAGGGRFQIMLPGYLYGSNIQVHFLHGNEANFSPPALNLRVWESLIPVSGGPFDSIANENNHHYPIDGDIALDSNDIGYVSTISPFSRESTHSLTSPGSDKIVRDRINTMTWPSSIQGKHAFSANDNRPWLYSVRFVGDGTNDASKKAFVFGVFITCDPEANL